MNDDPQKSDTPEPEVKPEQINVGESTEGKPKKAPSKRRSKPVRKKRTKEKKGVGFVTVFIMMLMAAVGGAVLSQIYNQFGPSEEQSVSAAQLQALEAKIATLPAPETVDLAPLKARIEALESRPDVVVDGKDGIPAGVPTGIETRLATLESQTPPDIDALLTRLSDLEARAETTLSAMPETDNSMIEALVARVDALEKSEDMSGLETRLSQVELSAEERQDVAPELLERLTALETALQTVPEPVDLTSIEVRIAALESEAQTLKSTQADVLKATTPIPPFPSDAVLKALENTETSSDKGWFGKTFDKYVLADNAEAIKTVSRVESLLQQGRVDMALEQVESLPEPGQTAAKDWLDAVKAKRR